MHSLELCNIHLIGKHSLLVVPQWRVVAPMLLLLFLDLRACKLHSYCQSTRRWNV